MAAEFVRLEQRTADLAALGAPRSGSRPLSARAPDLVRGITKTVPKPRPTQLGSAMDIVACAIMALGAQGWTRFATSPLGSGRPGRSRRRNKTTATGSDHLGGRPPRGRTPFWIPSPGRGVRRLVGSPPGEYRVPGRSPLWNGEPEEWQPTRSIAEKADAGRRPARSAGGELVPAS